MSANGIRSGKSSSRSHSGGESLDLTSTGVSDATPGYRPEDLGGPDDPRWRAVELLADAWGPALRRSHDMGHAAGFEAGRWWAEREMAQAWSKAIRPIVATLRYPTQDELRIVRDTSAPTPCTATCGLCSRCIRAAVVVDKIERWGATDYPGTATPAESVAKV